ncbi:MAG: asparagine synthase (glutamine-hydrolyzing) [Betaproteobacteria bacterium]|jgi:asparagine synthase (glutamine-hydrolysing)|nr:asparagine synthase (glutamine-hydrolyzing) [Rubrivivax sp.]
MCGLAGFLDPRPNRSTEDWPAILDLMGQAIRHRGPDGQDVHLDAAHGLGMVHRRLSIIDLSPAGRQPMRSASGRHVIVYNGEVYNHRNIRRALDEEGSAPFGGWRGHSDTETLLQALEVWGPERALRAAVGMFALALWDVASSTLVLARDRLGEKPLYYGNPARVLLFGSELKALRAHPTFVGRVDRGVLGLFMRHSCVPAPHSIYEGVRQLPPGTWLRVHAGQLREGVLPTPEAYWSLGSVAIAGNAAPFAGSDTEAIDLLHAQLREAVALQMVADVPLGAFLSGGVDSSTVVALMQSQSMRPVKTFTIGFREPDFDEAQHARAVAAHLGTEHTELYVTAEDARAIVHQLPQIYDEPFADISQIPTYAVAALARRHVTVSLSGDAGDELFGGYNRYLAARSAWRRLAPLPLPLRAFFARLLDRVPPHAWNAVYAGLKPLLPTRFRVQHPAEMIRKLIAVFTTTGPEDLYRRLVSQWKQPEEIVIGGRAPPTLLDDPARWPAVRDFEHWMMAMDTRTYLPDDILTKVDRAAMAVSLETRVPMLDHRVVELAWHMPLALKIRHRQGKWLLRQVLYRYVPAGLIERPKMGFAMPVDSWLRGPLREWADSLLDPARLAREGMLQPEPISRMWKQHLAGERNMERPLWNVLMFQAWLEQQNGAS